MFINIGILLAYLAGVPYEQEFSGFNLRGQFVAWWRCMVALQLLPALLQVGASHWWTPLWFCPAAEVQPMLAEGHRMQTLVPARQQLAVPAHRYASSMTA